MLSAAHQAAIVKNSNSAPKLIPEIDDATIQKLFADALEAEPPEPERFYLYFNRGTTEIDSKSLNVLSKILNSIHLRQSHDISIIGHTDRVGSDEFNQNLSLQRAWWIQKLLIKAGIDPNALFTTSHGEGNPLIQTKDNVEEPRNRRVEVIIR